MSNQTLNLLNNLLSKFKSAEEKKMEHTEEYKKLVLKVSDDNSKLPEALIKCIETNSVDIDLKIGIFKILRKLLSITESKEKIKKRLLSNKDFSTSLIKFILSNQHKNKLENPLYIMKELYTVKDFEKQINEEFITALFTEISESNYEENVIIGVIAFLAELSKTNKDTFLDCHSKLDKTEFTFFNEGILSAILTTNKRRQIKEFENLVNCLSLILQSQNEREVLHASDIETLTVHIYQDVQMIGEQPYVKGYLTLFSKLCETETFEKFKEKEEYKTELNEFRDILKSAKFGEDLNKIVNDIVDKI